MIGNLGIPLEAKFGHASFGSRGLSALESMDEA